MKKVCTKCGKEKLILEFHKAKRGLYGVRSDCKVCGKIYKAKNYELNREKFLLRNKLWFRKNKERRKKYENKRSRNPKRRIENILRVRLREALRGNFKSGSAVRDLGCSVEFLIQHIENQFQSGMFWNNWSVTGWHIDHIKPLSKFDLTDRKQFLEACHYKNLQPMWAKENLSKGSYCEKD